jgi:hypothetical protein
VPGARGSRKMRFLKGLAAAFKRYCLESSPTSASFSPHPNQKNTACQGAAALVAFTNARCAALCMAAARHITSNRASAVFAEFCTLPPPPGPFPPQCRPAPPWPFVSIGFARSRQVLAGSVVKENQRESGTILFMRQPRFSCYTPRIGLRVSHGQFVRCATCKESSQQQ